MAQAQAECGIPDSSGTVICSNDGNPYAGGITYVGQPDDLTVVLDEGVSVHAQGALNGGITLGGSGALTLNGATTTIAADGPLANGITALSSGGDISLSATNVIASGADGVGILAASDSGDVTIVSDGRVAATGRGGSGIIAISNTGSVFVDANVVTTAPANAADTATSGSAIFAQGATADVIATGGVVSVGGFDTIVVDATAGDASASVNGVRASGAGARALAVSATGHASATIDGGVAVTGLGADAVVVSGDTASVTIGRDGVLGSQHGNIITISSVNGSTIDNAGRLPNAGQGYTIEALGGPITINNSGSLHSNILLTSGNDRINNSGEFLADADPDFGAGNDVFHNTGTVSISRLNARTRTFVGLERFENAGLIDLRSGAAGDVLILPGSYVGSGDSRLALDVTDTAADQLVVGGSATGNTVVLVDLPATGAASFNSGTTLVRAGAGSSADAFDLEGGARNAGLVRYEIVYDPQDFSYSLTAAPSDAAYRTLNYVEGARNLWLKSADVVSGQLRARRDALWAFGGGDPAGKLWVQMHGSVESRDTTRAVDTFGQVRGVNTGFRQDYYGGQIGFDFSGGAGERGGFAVGVTGGYINSSQNFRGAADRIDYDVVNAGVYASYSSGNLFANALGKYDYYWAKANSPLGEFRQKFKGDSYGARGEVGMRFGGDSFFVEPAASLSYVKTSFDDFTTQGVAVDFNSDDGLRGRAGARVGGQFALGAGPIMAFYLGGNYVHEFQGEDRVTISSGGEALRFANRSLDDYGEGILGFTIGQTDGVSGFIEGSYIRSFKDGGRRTGIEGAGGRAGLRISF